MSNQWVDYCNELAAERKQVLSWAKNNHGLIAKVLEKPDNYFIDYSKYSEEDGEWHYDTYILRYQRASLPNIMILVEYPIEHKDNKYYYITDLIEKDISDFSIEQIEEEEEDA